MKLIEIREMLNCIRRIADQFTQQFFLISVEPRDLLYLDYAQCLTRHRPAEA
jgi:hypothetical protein